MRYSRPARLIDVAQLAGVGKTTASDALTGTGRVSAATRESVLAAAKQLGYTPNSAARHLRRSATGTIAVLLPEVSARSAYYMAFVFGIVNTAADADYDVTIVTRPAEQSRERVIRADGVIISDPRRDDPAISALISAPAPVVTVEHVLDGDRPAGVVWSDHEAGMARLLAELDRTRFTRPALVVAADDTDWSSGLVRGFRAGCTARGAEAIIRMVSFEAPSHQVRAATEDLLADNPGIDAIVVGPDGGAIEVLSVLNRLGRVAGVDIAVASCVDYAALQFVEPSITAIDLRPREAGVASARLLLDLLDGTAEPGTERVHEIDVVARESTARPLDRSSGV